VSQAVLENLVSADLARCACGSGTCQLRPPDHRAVQPTTTRVIDHADEGENQGFRIASPRRGVHEPGWPEDCAHASVDEFDRIVRWPNVDQPTLRASRSGQLQPLVRRTPTSQLPRR
jgi:hypothetical protein